MFCERVRQSRQRQGSLTSNFTSKVQLHYEKINNPKRPLWLWLIKKVRMMLIMVITSVCSFNSNMNRLFLLRKPLTFPLPSRSLCFSFTWLKTTMPSHFFFKCQLVLTTEEQKHILFSFLALVAFSTWQHLEKRVLEPCHPSTSEAILVLNTLISFTNQEKGKRLPPSTSERGQRWGVGDRTLRTNGNSPLCLGSRTHLAVELVTLLEQGSVYSSGLGLLR